MGGPARSVRLPFWSRPAPDERQHAIATLQSLGTTSVPGLAAALSWSVPRTEKVLRELSRRGPPGLVYDSRTGTIRWGNAPSSPSRSPSPPPVADPTADRTGYTVRPPARSGPVTLPTTTSSPSRAGAYRPTVVPPAPTPPTRIPTSDHALRECSRCHTPLVPTGVAEVFACPMCGRRISSAGTLVSPSPSRTAASVEPDPRIQQLIAAWATGQPAPCPHCRQPLRHTVNGEFRCGSCGAHIAYEPPSTTAPPVPGGPMVGPSR